MSARLVNLLLMHLLLTSQTFAFNTKANSNVVVECKDIERLALLSMKQDLQDDHKKLSSWGNEEQQKECCKWEGVHCNNKTGHVTKLDLCGNKLRGKINPSLSQLHHLNYLDLSYNNFNFTNIPNSIGSLTNLRYLNLSYAALAGEIPHEIGNLLHLKYLDLGLNFITGIIPHHLGNISQLQYLDLSSPYLSSDLEWLSNFPSLKALLFEGVNLTDATNWLKLVSNLSQLEILDFYNCYLPDDVHSNLSLNHNLSKSLAVIDLSFNNLTSSIFPWLLNFGSSLNSLTLSHNIISGPLPEAFGKFSSLEQFVIECNLLESEIPQFFWDFCRLDTLSLYDNKLNGQLHKLVPTFPRRCAQKSLQYLSLGWNQFSGSLPDLSQFQSLQELYLDNNQLNGTLSESLGQLSNLEVLSVSHNQLQGVISEVHFLKQSILLALDLSFNELVFNVSSNWIPPFRLAYINLASCKLGPCFPAWLRTQKNYYSLDISSAGIFDQVPDWFWGLSPIVQNLNLSHNQMRGQIKISGFIYSDFPAIDLNSNMFEGSVPAFLSVTTSLDLSNNKFSDVELFLCVRTGLQLTFLDLANNQLSGELPECWMNLQSLAFLDLTNNSLHGNIPTSMGSLIHLQAIHLGNNNFSGEIPSSLSNCQELRIFDVVGNNLTGPIPSWIGDKLGKLIVLSLRSNSFSRSLPSNLCHLGELHLLDLSLNNISGHIPKCLNNLTALARKVYSNATISYTLIEELRHTSIQKQYSDSASIIWKGQEAMYKNTLGLVRSIDLSNNCLSGKIPSEIMNLVALVSLNISRNELSGEISSAIGQLESLDFLDLSRNHLSGRIPLQLSKLNRLSVMDLSYNNLSGEIPLGTQLQSFDASSYEGNELCGDPLSRKCPSEQKIDGQKEENWGLTFAQSFGISMAIGFILGFWGVCGSLILNKSWRCAYFKFWSDAFDKLYISTTLNLKKLQRKLRCSRE